MAEKLTQYLEKMGKDLIQKIFTEVFTDYGYSVRKGQVDLSKKIYLAMFNRKILLSDIPVGLGKTHAYLVAGIVYYIIKLDMTEINEPIIITTSSIELQRAIINDYLPDISKMLLDHGIIKKSISAVLRKGKENYICDRRYLEYIKNIKENHKLKDYKALRDIAKTRSIDLDDFPELSHYDKKRICVNSNVCATCNMKKSCRHTKYLDNAVTQDYIFQICNHNYYLADVIRRKEGRNPLIPDYEVVVIDEAHKLIYASKQMYSKNLNHREIIDCIDSCKSRYSKTKKQRLQNQYSHNIVSQFNDLFKYFTKDSYVNEDKMKQQGVVITKNVKRRLNDLITALRVLKVLINNNWQLHKAVEKIISDLVFFRDKEIVCWIEKSKEDNDYLIKAEPIRLEEILYKDIWSKANSMILTSGTLAVKNNFNYIENELGIKYKNQNKIETLVKESPFNHKDNCALYIPNNSPHPNSKGEKYINSITQMIKGLINVSNGHALILFTSYKTLKLVYENIHDCTIYPMYQMSRGNKNTINEFKASANGVLFATGSAWEGIDIPGNLLSHLIIIKLPFPIPDPMSDYKSTKYNNREQFMNEDIIPKMLIKLKQGAGRLIRHEKDTGVITILDKRCSNQQTYNKNVIEALPNCRKLCEINELKKFYTEKKDVNYFINR